MPTKPLKARTMALLRNEMSLPLLTCLIVCFILMLVTALDHDRVEKKRSWALTSTYWKVRITILGPQHAYDEMVRALANLNPQTEHIGGHAFGSALYELRGTSSIHTCDRDYSWACVHGFMLAYFYDRGKLSLEELGAICDKEAHCLHGIGHGLIAEADYDPKQLENVLSRCTLLPEHDQAVGCWAGVFMGYDLRTPSGDSIREDQRLIRDDPLAPCDSLSQGAYVCYYWQSQVWKNTWNDKIPDRELAKKMGGILFGTSKERSPVLYRWHGRIAFSDRRLRP